MPTITEKRVYDDVAPPVPVFVAAAQGLVVAHLSDDSVGEFSLAERCTARDVAIAPDGTLVLATDEATLIAPDADPERFRDTGFGPATTVSVGDDPRAVVAVDDAGRAARLPLPDDAFDAGSVAEEDWTDLGTVESVRAADGRLVATADGVRRVTESGLDDAGLDDARDVAARGAPLAATGEGLYELGNGWMVAREGPFATVATDGERAHAVADDGEILARPGSAAAWTDCDLPTDDRVVDVTHTPDGVVAATESGSLLATVGDGWRSRAIGVTGVQAAAAGPRPETE